MRKDKSVIPKGSYCDGDANVCPYWSVNKRYHKHQNGYCAYLEKGDWDINKEPSIPWMECGGKRTNFDPPRSPKDL